jgi:formylglycine-generating enzyme required for sulfatase activity
LYVVVVFLLALAACAPKTATATTVPQVTEPPATQTATEPPTLVPTVLPTNTEAVVPSPTLVVFDLSGPPMQVGSTYLYVDGSILVAVPAGPFIMGHGGDDNPEHTVTLNDFWIYRSEVSNKQYALCVALGQCSPPDAATDNGYGEVLRVNEPVTGVNWDQAAAYCKFVKGRLPTEAEWEKTARGPDGNIYPWGDASPSCDLANIGRCRPRPVSVIEYPAGKSYYEALNMSGNILEWVSDWYSLSYYSISPAENPLGPETGTFRSVRSSSYDQDFRLAESARRWRFKPVETHENLGFRCVVEDPTFFAPWCQVVAYVGPDQGGGVQAPDSIPTPICPNVSVSSSGFCNTNKNPKTPAANLHFGPNPLPPDTLTTYPGGCTGGPNDFYCEGGGSASIQAKCTVPPPPIPAGCPAGYTQDGNTCNWTGGGTLGTQCLPGSTYDPVNQCCTSAPGVGDAFGLCPVSAPYYVGGICVSWPSADYTPLQTIDVTLGSCGTGGNNNSGEACAPRDCYVGVWDPKLCCCSRTPGVCDGQ